MALITAGRSKGKGVGPQYGGPSYVPKAIDGFVKTTERDMPWNVLGKTVTHDGAMTAAEALKLSGMDYTIEKHQALVTDPVTGKTTPIANAFVTGYVDGDSFEMMGMVSDKYRVVQPAEAFGFVDEVLALHDGAHYSSVWTMKEKRQMGVTVEFPEHIVVDPNGAADRLGVYGLGVNSFDGSTGLQFVATTTRFFCMNQLNPALKGARRGFCLKHTSGVMTRVQDAREALGVTMTYAAELDAVANALYGAKFTDRQFARLVREVFPITDDMGDLAKSRMTERHESIIATWEADHNANITGTKWGALNVMGEWADWGRKVNGSPRTGTDPVRQRAIGTMVNFPTALKTRVLERLAA